MDGSAFGGTLSYGLPAGISGTEFDSGHPSITARLAIREEHLREAWSIRHDAYAAEGLIDARANGMLIDENDLSPSVNTIVIYKNAVPVATTRVCLYEPESKIPGADFIPAMTAFNDQVVELYRQTPAAGVRPRLVENTRLARHPSLGSDSDPVFGLYRMVCYLLLHMEADGVLASVQKHHMPFYRRLGMTQVGAMKIYPKFQVEAALMACVRKEGSHLRDSLKVLGLVAKTDRHYYDFVSGEQVPVFGTNQAPAELTGFMGGRFERPMSTRRREPERAETGAGPGMLLNAA